MAKSSNFFGLRTGSTKSLTFSVYRGQQITKDRVTRISNPRTTAQMQQRALIPMVAAARSILRGIVDHSFEGIPYGEASLKEFSAQNLKKDFLTVVSYSPRGYSNMGFADFLVSKGSIADSISVDNYGEGFKFEIAVPEDVPMKFPAVKAKDSADVIFSYIEKYARDNSVADLQPGTQITPIAIRTTDEVSVKTPTGTKKVYLADYSVVRFLIPDSTTSSTALADVNAQWKVEEEIAAEGAASAKLYNADGDKLELIYTSGSLDVIFAPKVGAMNVVGGAVILSRYSGNVWRRNTARLQVYDESIDPKFTFDDWASQYGSSASSASEEYLNNGTNSPDGGKTVKPVTPAP